ncbi:hypothetical protein BGZ63DRAFT_173416 [Mariannaea sp. PMI_226]|nr:hypothetical protein BGZ63DRAFT_173416 [Mariannaea sp. PMI_226]
MAIQQFIDSIIAAHGGQAAYSALDSIKLDFTFTGALLGLKGRPGILNPTSTVSTKEQKVVYRGLGGSADEEWVFTPNRVWKQRAADGTLIAELNDPRKAFEGHVLDTPWDDFHFIFFCGTALWQYANFPYLLARDDVKATEVDSHQENGQTWRVLEVQFPEQSVLTSHSSTQKYYFDDKFVLQRHDYAPWVLAGSPAAHYVYDEVVVGGLTFPTLRRVIAINPADGTPLYHGPIPTLVHLIIRSIMLNKQGTASNGEYEWALTAAPRI